MAVSLHLPLRSSVTKGRDLAVIYSCKDFFCDFAQ